MQKAIDMYKMVAVIESTRNFTSNDCLYANVNKNEVNHLSVNSQIGIRFDELISFSEQVKRIGKALAFNFVTQRNSNKVVINIAD